MATLTLVRDGDKGNPLGTATMQDDGSDFSDALGEVSEQAEKTLEAEKEAREAKAEALHIEPDENDPEIQALTKARAAAAEQYEDSQKTAEGETPKGAKTTAAKAS